MGAVTEYIKTKKGTKMTVKLCNKTQCKHILYFSLKAGIDLNYTTPTQKMHLKLPTGKCYYASTQSSPLKLFINNQMCQKLCQTASQITIDLLDVMHGLQSFMAQMRWISRGASQLLLISC